MTRTISAVATLLLTLLLLAASALAESTVTLPEHHVDHPELYPLPAPAKKNIDLIVMLKTPVTADDVQSLSDWLTEQGFRIGDTGNGWITMSGSIEDAEGAFQTKIMMTREGTYGNLSDPKIPARFANVVQSISGLTEIFLAPYKPARRTIPVPTPQPHSRNSSPSPLLSPHPDFRNNGTLAFGPSDAWTFYDAASLINSGINGSSVDCIALTEGSTFTTDAVTLFSTTFGLPQLGGNLTTVLVGTGQIQGDQTEALIDIEWSHALAPMAKIKVYISANTPTALQAAIAQAVNDNTCGTISISQTLCGNQNSYFSGQLDPLFRKAAQQGQAIFTGTGDLGANNGTITSSSTCPPSTPGIKELAADPYVTAVGGTMFTPTYDGSGNDVGFVAESVWKDGTGASGGGVSQVFPEPAYQALQNLPAGGFRAIPDVALGASPNSPGFWFVDGNQTLQSLFAGTSLSAPAWAGIGALLADQTKHRVGNINSRLYQMGPLAASTGIRDVTAGDNTFAGVPGVSAGVGYDEASGWGTPDVTKFANAFPGEVLISGGEKGTTVWQTAETFDPITLKFTATSGNMSTPRMCHTSTRLANGKTLVAGGLKQFNGGTLASADLYTPSTGTFAAIPMVVQRAEHRAAMLKDGTVLVLGGLSNNLTPTNTAEVYDPAVGANGTFASVGSMATNRVDPTATLLSNGRVLVTGETTDNSARFHLPRSTTRRLTRFPRCQTMVTWFRRGSIIPRL